jgi:hypothetical protein
MAADFPVSFLLPTAGLHFLVETCWMVVLLALDVVGSMVLTLSFRVSTCAGFLD